MDNKPCVLPLPDPPMNKCFLNGLICAGSNCRMLNECGIVLYRWLKKSSPWCYLVFFIFFFASAQRLRAVPALLHMSSAFPPLSLDRLHFNKAFEAALQVSFTSFDFVALAGMISVFPTSRAAPSKLWSWSSSRASCSRTFMTSCSSRASCLRRRTMIAARRACSR